MNLCWMKSQVSLEIFAKPLAPWGQGCSLWKMYGSKEGASMNMENGPLVIPSPFGCLPKKKLFSVNIPNYDALIGHIAGLFSLEPVDVRPRQFYIGTSSQSLQIHLDIFQKFG